MSAFAEYKLGKLTAAVPRLATLSAYTVGNLPTPPAVVTPPTVTNWDVLGNDKYGDCTIAGAAHIIMAANAEVQEADAAPNTDDVVKQYFDITGGHDTGCVEYDVLHRWYTKGLFGANRIAGYTRCNAATTELYSAISLYGACYVGVALPSSAQRQFAEGQPWSVVDGDRVVGGHCIVFVGYDANYLYAVTWGKVQRVSYLWWHTYGDESWAVIPQAFVEKGSGPTVDVATLQRDLDALK